MSFHRKIFSFFLSLSLIGFCLEVSAQSNLVKVNVQVLPPYNNNIHHYIGGGNELDIRLQEQLIITLQNNSPTQSQEIKLKASITGDNGIFASVNRDYLPLRSITLGPGELRVISGRELKEINRNLTENNITYGGFDKDQLLRTGTLPEGNYKVCIEAYDYNTNQRLSLSEPMGCSPPIPIAYPDPPVIVYPFHNAEVLATEPQALNISWAAAPNLSSVVRYRLRIIELSDINANPYDLFERSTISFFEADNITNTNFFYDISRPELKLGKTYAIRVQAYDPFGRLQIKNNGWSEIHVFKYLKTLSDGTTIADIDYLNLEPGFLKLVDLDQLEVREEGNNLVFNGNTQLEITASEAQEPEFLRVKVNNLVVQKGNNVAPLILDGEVSANVGVLPFILRPLDGLVAVDEMTWQAASGLNVTGTIRGPTGETYQATGDLTVTQDGIYGEIGTEQSTANPLFTFGKDPVQLAVTKYGITFPDVCKSFEGELKLFNDQSITVATQSCGEEVNFDINMWLDKRFQVDNGSGELYMEAQSLTGYVQPNWKKQTLAYDLDLVSSLGFNNIDSVSCGLDLLVNLHSENGINIEEAGKSCYSSQNTIPLGPAYLAYKDFKVNTLKYDAETSTWYFELSLDGQFTFPVFGGFTTTGYQNILVNEQGIAIPSMNYQQEDIFLTSAADWGDYLVYLEEFIQSAVTLPIFKPEKIGPGDWDFAIRARVEFKDDENIPECLRGGALNITGVNFEDKVMAGMIEPQNIGDCTWEFGAGYAMNFNSVEGKVSVQFEGSRYSPLGGELKLDFDFLFGEPFACSGENQVAVLDSELKIKNGLNGEVDQIAPPCDLKIGPLTANVTQSTLRFESSSNLGQNIFLDGEATLNYKELNTKGTFSLDLKTGKFTNLSFQITETFVLDLPTEDKVISFNINEAEISENGLLIDGRNELKLANQTIGATFDNLLLDLSDNHIRAGSVIIDSPFAFEASIDEQNQLQFKAVAKDHELVASPGLLMQLAGSIKIDSTGLESYGTATAAINFEDIVYDSIQAAYDENFRLGFYPFQISKGQVDFYYEQQRVAYADGTGFHPDWSSFGDAFIPERIPLPTEEIAYIQIKQNDQLLVNIREDSMGNTVVSTKPGQPVQLFVPSLQGAAGQVPQIAVDFNELVLDGSNGSVIGGSVVATVPDNDPAFDLRQQGIPITPKQIAFGVDDQGDVNVTGLFIKGNLNVFDKDLGQPASIVVGIQSDGHMRGSVNLQGINASVPMLALKDYVRLNFKNITGSIDIPLLTANPNPYFDINFDSDFQIFNASDSLVVGAELSARYRPNDLSITNFNATVNQESASIDLDPFSIGITSLNNLSISYTKQEGFNFTTAIDCTFGYQLSNGTHFEFPLKNVELGSLNGFTIPAQDIHEGSWPGFDPPAVDFGIFRLQPLAFRLPSVNINWFAQSVNVGTIDPKIDLELSFPQLQYDAPEFSQSTFTFNDIGFDNGVLTGSMLPFTFPGDGVFVPIGGNLGINVKEIAGLLEFASDSLQGFDINLKGKLKYPDFLKKDDVCTQTQVSLNIDRNANFTGLIQDFTPCGELNRGPLTLKFNTTELRFEVSEEGQQASLSGDATALIERSNNTPVNATGNIGLDLINGKLTDGSLLFTGPFEWQYTEQDSLFAFTVQTAKLDTTGLVFTGTGALKLGNGSSNLTYNDLTFSLGSGKLTDGSVQIQNEFALDVALNPVAWSVEDPAVPSTNNPGIRMTMPANLLLDKNGLTVSDSSVASLSYNEQQHDLLKVHFDDFNLGVDPVRVKSGKAEFFLDSINGSDPIRIAYYDQTGFHLDDGTSLIKAVLPDTLYLPTEDIAYIVLRNQNGDLMVDIESVAEGKKINTQAPLPMVVNAFDPNDPMTMDVRIYDLIINDAFEVVQGYIESDLSGNPINLLPTEDVPLQLTRIAYLKDGNNPYSLFADAKLVLPQALNEVEVELEKLELGPGGFKAALVKAGVYRTTYDPNQPMLVDHSFSQGEFQIAVSGVELDFDQSGNAYRMSGQLGSSIFKDENGDTSIIHYAAQYSSGVGWEFDLDAHHLPQMEIPIDKAKMILDNLEANFDDTKFELVIDSRLTFDDVMGDNFEITVNGFKVGTNGVSIDNINTNAVQYLSLFNETDNLELTDLGVSFDNSILFISLDGSLNFLERDLDFTALKIGTDGSISLDGLNANLLTQDFEILGQYLVLKEIGLTTLNGKIALTAGGEVNMPEPFEQSDNALTITVNYQGQADVEMPSLTATNIPDVDLGGFAILDMTEVGIDFDPMDVENTAFFASADLNIPDDKNGGVNTIAFGTPNGDINSAGIYYRYSDNDINWQITNSPNFSFDQTFFKLSLENISAGRSGGFQVTMDAQAALQFEQVGGGGRMEGITIDKTGVDWGTFAGANFTFINFVNIEVGSFEYFNDGGTITLEKGAGNGPGSSEVSEESIYVDEYLKFSSATGSALSISIGDEDGFSVSGGIDSIMYYKKGDELYFNMRGANIKLPGDMARLYASVEYQRNDTGFLLRVAGGAEITPPGVSPVGVVAVGKLANINGQFSMGIFVATKGVPIPIIPAIIEINKFGGGFFYHAESADLNLVTEATDYEPYKQEVPWESGDRSFDFAIIFYGGIGVIGTTNTYTFTGEMMMVIASDFLLIDSRFDMNTAPLEGGAYFSMDFQPDKFILEAGGGMQLKDLGVVKGGLGVNFTAIKFKNQDNLQWAFTGGTTVAGGEPIEIVGILEANATVVVSNDGFLLDCSVEAGFDIWIVSVNGGLQATVWYLKQQEQFGIYAEVYIEASVLGGLATLGGNAIGALIIEKGDFIIYASLTGYVEVFGVFDGNMTAWISIQNSGFDAGLGKSGYEDMIAEARRNAQKLNEKADELLASIEDAKNAIVPLSNETLARAGQALFMAPQSVRNTWGSQFIQNEQRLESPVDNAFVQMRNRVVDGGRPEQGQMSQMLSQMKSSVQILNQKMTDVIPRMQELKASAIEWESEAQDFVTNLQNPAQVNSEWQGDIAPSFSVDTVQAAKNRNESASLKQSIDQLSNEAFEAAIDTTLANIHKIETIMDGRTYSLVSPGTENNDNIAKMANYFTTANYRVRRYYSKQISYFWALRKWANFESLVYDQYVDEYWNDGPLDLATKDMITDWGMEYTDYADLYDGDQYEYAKITMGGVEFYSGAGNNNTWPNLSSQEKTQSLNAFNKSPDVIAEAVGQRRYLILKMDPEINDQSAQSQKQTTETNMKSFWQNRKFYDFIRGVKNSSNEIYKMHSLGIAAIEGMAQNKADSLVQAAKIVLEDLDNKHQDFTAIQNDIYQIKHSTLISLYSMYELFEDFVSRKNGEEAADQLRFKLRQLEDLLTAPKINKVSLITHQGENKFDRELMIGWNAFHPYQPSNVGTVENSYSITPGPDYSIYASNFKSLGSNDVMSYHMFSDDKGGTAKDIAIKVRVRGPGGNAITRYANTKVQFDAIVYVDGEPVGGSTSERNILPGDGTPPNAPIVTLGYKKNQPAGFTEKKYWSNDFRNISIGIIAMDNESDIAKVEYAIGSTKGGNDIVDWKEGLATNNIEGNNSFGNVAQTIMARNLNLEEGKDYYVSARVTNGAGLTSDITEQSTPLRLDLGRPADLTEELIFESNPIMVPVFFPGFTYTPNVVTETPALQNPPTPVNGDYPKVDVRWNAGMDSLSGIYQYEYVVSDKINPNQARETGEVETKYRHTRRVYLSGDPLDFNDTTYVHVWAIDYAGNRSAEALTFARLPKDNTAPVAPNATIMTTPDGLRLFIKRPSYDPESRVKGFQYAVGSTPYGTDIRPWPEDGIHDDLEMNGVDKFILAVWRGVVVGQLNNNWSGSYDAPYYEIPPSAVPEGQEIYVSYRTVNGQGKVSGASGTGPVVLDTSAPPSPGISLTFGGGQLKIKATQIKDDQSGIAKVEYVVQEKYGGYNPWPQWNDFLTIGSLRTTPFDHTRTVTWGKMPEQSRVGIRLTNGNGMQSTYWFDGSQYGIIVIDTNPDFPPFGGFNINWD